MCMQSFEVDRIPRSVPRGHLASEEIAPAFYERVRQQIEPSCLLHGIFTGSLGDALQRQPGGALFCLRPPLRFHLSLPIEAYVKPRGLSSTATPGGWLQPLPGPRTASPPA